MVTGAYLRNSASTRVFCDLFLFSFLCAVGHFVYHLSIKLELAKGKPSECIQTFHLEMCVADMYCGLNE